MPFYYDANGTRIAFKYDNEMYYYVYNLQGDVTHILNASGGIVDSYEYDEWGKILNFNNLTAIAQSNPFRYRGYYYDNESGLYYLNSRYYNAELGRFINADNYDILATSPSSFTDKNLFSYCDNNPIRRSDSNGQIWTTIGIMAVGGVIGAGISAATSIITQKVFENNINWKSVLVAVGTGFVSGAIGASPLGGVGQTILGGIVGGASYIADSAVNNTEIDAQGLIISTGIGAISGRLSGSGANENLTITNTIDTTRKAITKEQRSMLTNPNYAQKSISSWINYETKNLSIEVWNYSVQTAKSDFLSNVAEKGADIFINIVDFFSSLRKIITIL